jgi:phosphoglycolate phosphatase-like HAD superfamily hydrolase
MIYIGDEIRDVKAAKKAAIPVAAVGWGFNSAGALEAFSPDFLLSHPDDLHQLVR